MVAVAGIPRATGVEAFTVAAVLVIGREPQGAEDRTPVREIEDVERETQFEEASHCVCSLLATAVASNDSRVAGRSLASVGHLLVNASARNTAAWSSAAPLLCRSGVLIWKT